MKSLNLYSGICLKTLFGLKRMIKLMTSSVQTEFFIARLRFEKNLNKGKTLTLELILHVVSLSRSVDHSFYSYT